MLLLAQILVCLNSELSVLSLWLRMIIFHARLNSEFLSVIWSPAKGFCALGCQGQNVVSGKIKKTPAPFTCLWESATSESIGPSARLHTQAGPPSPSSGRGSFKRSPGDRFHTVLSRLFLAKKEKSFFQSGKLQVVCH